MREVWLRGKYKEIMSTAAEYFTKLAQAEGLDEDTKSALLKAAGNPNVAKQVEESIMLRSDYSKNMDELTKQKTENVSYYNKLVATESHNQGIIKKYEDAYGALPEDGKKPLVVTGADVITRKDFDEAINRVGTQSIAVTKSAMFAASDYMHRFKEVLDPSALEAHALKTGLPLDAAYKDFIAPKLAEQDKTAREAEKKLAAEEAVRDYASKNKLPVDSTKEPTPFLSNVLKSNDANKAATSTSTSAREGFTEAWNNFSSTRAAATAK